MTQQSLLQTEKTRQREKSVCKIIKMEMYTGDDNLRQQRERIDKLSEMKLKLRVYQYLENLRNEVLADNLCRAEKNKERQQEEPVTDESRRTIIIAKIQAELLKRILPSYRSFVMAVKWMKIISENHQKIDSVHEELSKKVKERELQGNSIAETFWKLENVSQSKWKVTLDAWGKEKRNQILFSVLVDQVRKIRTRRCPQMAEKMMKKLQDRQLVLQRLQREMVKRVKERENVRQKKETVNKELMVMEIKQKEEMKERRNRLLMDTMSCQLERDIEDTHFVPRKLFLNGVETFKFVSKPKIAAKVENIEKEEPTISSSPLTYGDKSETKLKREAKQKLTLKNRLRRFFGFH